MLQQHSAADFMLSNEHEQDELENGLAQLIEGTRDKVVLDRYERQHMLPYQYMVEQQRFSRALDFLARTFVPRMYKALKAAQVPDDDIKHIIMADGRELYDNTRSVWHWLPLMAIDKVTLPRSYDEDEPVLVPKDEAYLAMPYRVQINEDPYLLAADLLAAMQQQHDGSPAYVALEIDPMQKRIIRVSPMVPDHEIVSAATA